jgi:hypothetical protein
LPPQTPRHFISDCTTYIQSPAINKGTNPFRTNIDRARSQTPYTINVAEYIKESDEGEASLEAPEDQDPAV